MQRESGKRDLEGVAGLKGVACMHFHILLIYVMSKEYVEIGVYYAFHLFYVT